MTCTSAESRGTHCSLQLRRTQVPTEASGGLTLFTIMPACDGNSVTDCMGLGVWLLVRVQNQSGWPFETGGVANKWLPRWPW